LKKYEKEVGLAADEAAKTSRTDATALKRINIGAGRKHHQVIVIDCIFILDLINKQVLIFIKNNFSFHLSNYLDLDTMNIVFHESDEDRDPTLFERKCKY
jgi:hypothetical protein